MNKFLTAVTVTIGLVGWQTMAAAQPILDLSNGGIQRTPLQMGLITAEEVPDPAIFGFKPGELQAGNWLILLPGGGYGPVMPGEPVVTPLTTLPDNMRFVTGCNPDGGSNGGCLGIEIYQSF
ncbi:MAG: hypothetical protein AAFZ80_09245 [Cyanobacteria bacterium P01_A01_bin.105]